MKVAVGYVRVSTEEQAVEGVSLHAQRERIEAWAKAHGFSLTGVHVDALSGAKAANRPGLQNALTDACKQKAALVVYSLSRLARSTVDALVISQRLEKCGADLVLLSENIDTTGAMGKMVFTVLAAFAQFERDQIAERTRMAMAHLRRRGHRISRHVPYGCKLSGSILKSVPEEQGVIKKMRRMKVRGASLHEIARRLKEKGVKSKRGGAWTAYGVSKILARSNADTRIEK